MVKLVEFNDRESEMGYDVADDLHFHMRNDTMFYRKQFLPTIVKVAQDVNEDEGRDSLLDPMIQRGVEHYCKAYNIPTAQRRLIDRSVLTKVKEMIMSDDVPGVQKGEQ